MRDGFAKRHGFLAIFWAGIPLAGFAAIAATIDTHVVSGFDRAILLSLRNPRDLSDPIGPFWLEEAARDVTALGSVIVVAILTFAAAGYFLIERKRGAAFLLLASVAGGLVLNDLFKYLFDRPRPDEALRAARIFTSSFPSGHAVLSSVAYLTLGAIVARTSKSPLLRIYILSLAAAITLLVGISRIYLGVHYPSDVLAGWCLGVLWASLCSFASTRLQRSAKGADYWPS